MQGLKITVNRRYFFSYVSHLHLFISTHQQGHADDADLEEICADFSVNLLDLSALILTFLRYLRALC
jgi:hypothetical protein